MLLGQFIHEVGVNSEGQPPAFTLEPLQRDLPFLPALSPQFQLSLSLVFGTPRLVPFEGLKICFFPGDSRACCSAPAHTIKVFFVCSQPRYVLACKPPYVLSP